MNSKKLMPTILGVITAALSIILVFQVFELIAYNFFGK